MGGARDGTETWAPTSSGAAAAHLDDAGQAAIDQTLAASAIVEELGSMRPDRFSFSLRSGRCQWEKEEFSHQSATHKRECPQSEQAQQEHCQQRALGAGAYLAHGWFRASAS